MSTALVPLAAGTVVRHDGIGGRWTPSMPAVRHDGLGGRWTNPEMGLGGVANPVDRTSFETSIPLPQAIVDALLQFNGVARRIAAREPYDCTREGFALGSDPQAIALGKHAVKWGMLRYIRRARTWARAYGGGAIILQIDDGRPSDEPVDESNIRRLLGAKVLNRWELYPHRYVTDVTSIRCGQPEVYQAQIRGRASMIVHHSRVVIMQGEELPEQVVQRQQGWHGSIFDQVWPALLGYQVALRYLPEMVAKLTQDVYQINTMSEGVSADLKAEMVARIEAQHAAKGVLGAVAIAKDESYTSMSRPVTGLKEAIEPLQLDLVANADGLPKVILFAETVGGLRSGDNPEVVAWYDNCAGRQIEYYTPPAMVILRYLALAKDGPCRGTVPPMELVWEQLYQPSQKEVDDSEKVRAERRSIDVNAGVVSSDEARTDPDVKRLYRLTEASAPATPGIEPGPDVETPANGPPSETVADLALNGAQVTGLLVILEKLNTGVITYAQARGALGLAFPTLRGREVSVLGDPADVPVPVPAAAPGATVEGPVTDDATPEPEPEDTLPDDVVSPQQAAERFGVSTVAITRLVRSAAIRHWGFGSKIRVSLREVAAAAARGQAEPESESGPDSESGAPAAE